MMWTICCTVTDKYGNSRLVSRARLRWHEASLHAACALLYLSGGLTWSLNPLLAGWGAWVLAAGLGMMWLGIAIATRFDGSGDVGHVAGWLGAGLTLAGIGHGAVGTAAAAPVLAVQLEALNWDWAPGDTLQLELTQ